MESDIIVVLMREGLYLVVKITTLLIAPSLAVGLVVSVFQAATQINEQTLSFLPRLLTTLMSIMIMGPWITAQVVAFVHKVLTSIPLILT